MLIKETVPIELTTTKVAQWLRHLYSLLDVVSLKQTRNTLKQKN